ncbi:MAG: hypothetical protein EPN85_11495 [Bacteroidetes bacterium]|nr:MAG: hypothetical protein EPN85_11495 [Bacteroidota bacterium]
MEKDKHFAVVGWKSELNASAFRFHTMIVLVAAIINPLWAFIDYFTIPEHIVDFASFRFVVSAITVSFFLFRKKFANNAEIIAFIPFIAFSVQNAYMYSVMDIPELQKHTMAYVAEFIGGGLFVLWRRMYSIILVAASLIVNLIFFYLFSPLSTADILANGGMLTLTIAILTIFFIQTRTELTKKEIISRLALAESNKQLAEKNEIIEEKNKDIRDSINYAQRIQKAILSDVNEIKEKLPESFILFKPKDIVSGDFYWFSQKDGITFIAAADCTGHGVPGAFMSMIANSFLNEVVNEKNILRPDLILNELRVKIIKALRQTGESMENKDGLDISFCAIQGNKLSYSGANNPLWIVRDIVNTSEFDDAEALKNEKYKLVEIPPDKQPIGTQPNAHPFSLKTLELKKGDSVYLFTDGFADQFGGPQRKKFKYRAFSELLLSLHDKSMEEQTNTLCVTIEKWMGELDQIDDILVIGLKAPLLPKGENTGQCGS